MKTRERSVMHLSDSGYHPDKSDLEQYFNLFLGANRPPFMPAGEGWHPAADMYETDSNVIVIVEIAGIDINDVELVLDKDHLHMRGLRREVPCRDKRQYHKMEVAYGGFERHFRLPSPVCADKVKAEYKDGILTIAMEKRPEPIKRKMRIRIQ
ncbi:Hsp20 family protein [bacterium]|nr:Hsp20 family protein [bacterium]